MTAILARLKTEPAYVAAFVNATIGVILLLPDWRAALAMVAVQLGGGHFVRGRVTVR